MSFSHCHVTTVVWLRGAFMHHIFAFTSVTFSFVGCKRDKIWTRSLPVRGACDEILLLNDSGRMYIFSICPIHVHFVGADV
jgi:hypothetical protein